MLLDEPTDGLDPNQKEHMQKLILKMGKNKTILISTHFLDEAETICSRILIMNKGRLTIRLDNVKILITEGEVGEKNG